MAKAGRSEIAFAKTTRPTIGLAVEREALFAHLDTPPGRAVVWISGPPGSGKTTLAASYVQARRMQSIWFQVDADDADPASFFHYLGHAARKLGAARSLDLPAFTPQHADDVASFARKFFRQLFTGDGEPLALVLDNLQSIPEDSGLHVALEAGFAQVPKPCCVIVTSRAEPPASLARLRAGGAMCVVTGKDLRIEPAEIVAIAERRGQTVSAESAAKLYERTQGWAAGLVLMLEHSKFSGRIAELPDDAAPQVIFDFLGGEIFDRFEPETREFLLRIACLPRMSASVAAELAGEPKAERLLINLARNDYFVRDVASEAGRVYQLHPLLREFLRNRAAQSMPEAISGQWLRRAALLALDAGQTEDAIALLIDAGDWGEVARAVLENADEFLAQGRSETLAAWLEMLPPHAMDANPHLLRTWAASRAYASPRAARQLFERAYDGFRVAKDHVGMLRSCCGVIDAIVIEFDDVTPLDRWLATLDDLLAQENPSLPSDTGVIAEATLIRVTLLRDPGNPRVAACLECLGHTDSASAAARLPTSPRAELALAHAMVALACGEIANADAAIDGMRASASELPSSARHALAIASSLIHLARGAYADAAHGARDALAASSIEGVHAYDGWLLAIVAVASLCAGECAAARGALEQLEARGTRLRRGDRACVAFVRCGLAILEGDAVGAQRAAKLALATAIETGIPWFESLARIALVQLQIGGADRRGMEAQLRAAEALAERLRSPWLRVGVHVSASAVARELGDATLALDEIQTAFRIGNEHGLRPPPGCQPHLLAELCSMALSAQVEPDYARTLVREGRLVPRTPPLFVRAWPWPLRIVTIGDFQCLRGDATIELSGKGPGRPMELLKVLVALGRHNVRADQLADALWPHMEADYAYKSFTATLHRLRRLFDHDEALILRDGRLTLNKAIVWVDSWAIEQLFDDFDTTLKRAVSPERKALCMQFAEDAVEIYRGPFLPDESEQPSYIACREQLRARLFRFLTHVARGFEESDAPDAAADWYLRFIEADELCEPLYRQLMLCYQRAGLPIDALTTYERLRTILAARLKTMPSPETQALYASIKSTSMTSGPR